MSVIEEDRQAILARSLNEMRRLRGVLEASEHDRTEPIAVVGMSCRMPGGATDADAFWSFLRAGGDGIGEVPSSRWDTQSFANLATETIAIRHAGLLGDIEQFDAAFFGISAREAAALDPQQRLLLEVSWEALERAGQAPDELTGTATGVFFGVTNYDYCQRAIQYTDPSQLDAYTLTSNASTFAAGRLSYWLGLSGPSMSVDTACSSSLVGLHLACQSLRAGETTAALAGGVNVLLSPEWFIVLDKARMLAPDGRCKTFDASADGYVRSEGCGVVVLKRLSDAVANGDRVLALIRGSAVNQDGRRSGVTVPNPAAQQRVVRDALAAATVDPGQVSYVEAHGTGTPLGDPIELRALDAVFGDRGADAPLLVGSVKTNVGHLEPAAGMAGLIKVICALEHEELPPHLHLGEVNPEIGLDELAIRIPTAVTPWPRSDVPRLAGVSSFGASGTNAHAVLQEGPRDERATEVAAPVQLLTLSAKTEPALRALAGRFRDHLDGETTDAWADVCFTAANGRAQFGRRLGVVAASADEASRLLGAAFDEARAPNGVRLGKAPPQRQRDIVFMFSGQGAQHPGMTQELYASEAVFRRSIDRCDAILGERAGISLLALLEDGGDAIHETRHAQPALFAVEYALAGLWGHWGIEPSVVIGHSIGELVAACVAGAMTLEDGLWLAARRGDLMQTTEPGAMAAVFTEPGHVEELLAPYGADLSVAAVNGPRSVVVSGREEALQDFLGSASMAGVRSKAIRVTRGFHSPLMDPVLDALEAEAGNVRFVPPDTTLISNVSGRPIADGSGFDAAYVREHARRPVQFHASLTRLLAEGHRTFLEIGPTPTLTGMTRSLVGEPRDGEDAPLLLASLRPGREDRRTMLDCVAALYTRGYAPNLTRLDVRETRRRVVLPTYPFQRSRHWLPASGTAPAAASGPRSAAALRDPSASQSLLGRRVSSPLEQIQFEAVLDAEVHECLGDCVMAGLPVVNIGVYLEVAIAAHRELDGPGPVAVEGCVVRESLVLETGRIASVQFVLDEHAQPARSFGFHVEDRTVPSQPQWRLHAQGTVRAATAVPEQPVEDAIAVRARLTSEMSGADFYRQMWRRGLFLGPSAQWVEQLWTDGAGETLAQMRAPRAGEAERYILHPGLTDALFQTLFACLPAAVSGDATYLIAGIDRFVVAEHDPDQALLCHARLQPCANPEAMLLAGAELLDGSGRTVVRAEGVCLARANAGQAKQPPVDRPRPRAARRGVEDGAPADQTPQGLRKLVVAAVAAALGAELAALDVDEPLRNLGLDSLMAFEIKDQLSARLGVALPLVTFLEGHSTAELSDEIVMLAGLPRAAQDSGSPADGPGGAAGEVLAQIVPDPASRSEPFELTDLQQAYLVGRSGDFELGGVATSFVIEVDIADMDLERAELALRQVIARHDMLRAIVTPDGLQQVLEEVPPYRIEVVDLTGAEPGAAAARLAAIRCELETQIRDSARWPLFDVRATRLNRTHTRLHVMLDALIIDAWSTSLMFREWALLYSGEQLPEPALTFRDYVTAAGRLRGGELHAASLAYWTERAVTLPPAPELPLARSPASIVQPTFVHRSGRLDEQQWARFKEHAASAGVTASAAICTAYAHVLATWSRSSHFTLNLLFFNRLPLHPNVDEVIGNFSATTLLEVRNVDAETFAVRADRLQRQLWSDLEHRYVSGVEVLRELNRVHRDTARATMPVVFASTVSFASKQESDAGRGVAHHLTSLGSGGTEVSSSIRTPQVWLDHQVVEDADGLVVNWDVVEQLFGDGLIDAMFAAYQDVLSELCADPAAWGRPLPVIVPEDDLRRRREVNATIVTAPAAPRVLHDGFTVAAATHPERCAVIADDQRMTYGELDGIVNQLDRRLRAAGAQRGSLVAVVMQKGWEQVAAVLAILRCGAAYVPIDPDVPPARLELLVETTEAVLALTQPEVEARLQWPPSIQRISVVSGCDDADAARPEPLDVHPDDLAYVIFTSGSTGTPKGVMIEHGAALNTVLDINERFGICATDRVLALSALNFDLSVWDIFGLLTAGGTIVLPSPSSRLEPAHWAELVEGHDITLWNTVPTLMEMFGEHVTGSGRDSAATLRLVMLSGDWIPLSLPQRVRDVAPDAALWSLGGATEASIWSILHPIEELDPAWVSIPYGKPMRNQQLHVLGESMRPCPQWVAGQLYIGGAGLARGYLADAARTRASFVRHPATGERLYRTGDLGRYLPDGSIEFLGREDGQVKIQGFRVELGEVEAALQACEGVRVAVAVAAGEARGAKRLLAYIVPTGRGAEPEALLASLRDRLPAYLVPQAIVVIDEVPLTANGKVDRGALPAPEQASIGPRRDVAPRDDVERRLVAIWEEFFVDRPLTVDLDFFAIGGNSLTAVRLMSQIKRGWGRTLPLSTMLERPTIELLAPLLCDDETDPHREALVRIRPGAGGPPLIFVHPIGGDVLCYEGLAVALGGDIPFLGLQTPDADAAPSIEALASQYVGAVLEAKPEGPYRLGGWSMGGVVALEMARQLAALGQTVQLVALIDLLEPPRSERQATISDAELLSWFARDLGALAGRAPDLSAEALPGDLDAALRTVSERARSAGALPADIDIESVRPIFARFARNFRALLDHRPEPYAGPVRFFRARDGGASAATAAAWQELFVGDAEVIDVPGDHYSVMRAPALDVLARALGEQLDALEQQQGVLQVQHHDRPYPHP